MKRLKAAIGVIALVGVLAACDEPVEVDITHTHIEFETNDGQRIKAPMESLKFNGLENLPTATPVPEKTEQDVAGITIYPELSAVRAEFASFEPEDHPDGRLEELVSSLEAESVTVEDRTISLPLAGDVRLSIVRTEGGDERTMDILETSLRAVENFMGYPFPDDHVIYHMHRRQEGETTQSLYLNTHVQITNFSDETRSLFFYGPPYEAIRTFFRLSDTMTDQEVLEYYRATHPQREGCYFAEDIDQAETNSERRMSLTQFCDRERDDGSVVKAIDDYHAALNHGLTTIVHEAIHYYYKPQDANETCATTWAIEGPPTYLSYVVMKDLNTDEPFSDDSYAFFTASALSPCVVETISEISGLSGQYFQEADCNYLLGSKLFEELHGAMDETNFRLGFRRFFLHTQLDTSACDDDPTPLCHVREAFLTYGAEETRPVIEEVIERVYGRAR